MSTRRYLAGLILIFGVAILMRGLWLRADPPVHDGVGIVWHDEGTWVHNARNRVMWGVWRTDEWNPVFIAPVFTAFEYASFRTFGVGLWQARLVPLVSGLVALAWLLIGLGALGGRRVALVGGALLATNYAFVMWNRAALMESTMTMFIVVGWAAYALAERRPAWGLLAGASAALAWFTKASAAFFILALVLDAAWVVAREHGPRRRAALWSLAGLAVTGLAIGVLFVGGHWREYTFYNWQVTVTRKPDYGPAALLMRTSWLPIVEDILPRMWLVLAAGLAGALAIAARWETARPAERLLVLWIVVGLVELAVHDSGNDRRYVMFIPALSALAAGALSGEDARARPGDTDSWSWRLGAAIAATGAGYLLVGSLLRPVFATRVAEGHLSTIVRLAALAAVVIGALTGWQSTAIARWLATARRPRWITPVFLVVTIGWSGLEYVRWARDRSDKNDEASVALGRLLPAGTFVQGKLANGLSLENRIRPLFVGNGFGNYRDRLERDDVRYILTYDLPRIGYESSDGSGLIQGILDHYPGWRIVATFEVDETPDQAALIDKFPAAPPRHARD